MDIKPLLDLTCATVASMIKGKTPEEIRLQFNIVNRATLLAAQREPEKYRNLLVRVAGYSAYFTELDRELQEEIIARTGYERDA